MLEVSDRALQMLETMRDHLRHLQQAQGKWDTYSDYRSWNDPSAVKQLDAAPSDDSNYR